jgi:hypothetical protein
MKVQYITVYLQNRAYGGSEEGGWWFDTGEAVKVLTVLPAKAQALLERVRRWCERTNREEGRRSLGSVLCDGRWGAILSDEPGEDYPQERPYYE